MALPSSGIHLILGILLLFQSDYKSLAQTRRSTVSRSLGINPKSTTNNINNNNNSNNNNFNCPEEFGYYPHPNDCTQYYVCVFGSALLESCTGGLRYSHELQTCDWPRNVGCEVSDDNINNNNNNNSPIALTTITNTNHREISPKVVPQIQQQQQQQQQQPQTQKFRFTSITSTQSPQISNHQQQYQQPQQQQIRQQSYTQQSQHSIPAQVQSIPLPPQIKVSPNPVITSRGQPKPFEQADIAKLYAEAHETLPPVEEEESDRQQRVYRGQPSTLGQVQRDRDGIIQQNSVNAIPNHGKVGSYAFGSQLQHHRLESSTQSTPINYIQQQKNLQNNRNYYNTSNIVYNNPSQQHQQQQQQQYDAYYSVYDDDIDLYRDVDYGNTQYTNSQKPIQSTYRPSTVSTIQTSTSLPIHQQSYIKQNTGNFEEEPAKIYNSAYDEALAAQLDIDNGYDLPSRTPLRGDRNELNSISDQPFLVSSTLRTPPPISPQYTSASTYTTPSDIYSVTATTTIKTTTQPPPPPPSPPPTSTTTTTTTSPTTRSNVRNRGNSHYTTSGDEGKTGTTTVNRGTHPPRLRPTLKPSGSIVSKAAEFIDIYRFPPSRPEPLYPTPTPDKTAAKCRKDVCLLPDCYCGGRDIPADMPVEDVPQIVLLTFDDSVNDLNKQLYTDLFEKGRVNPNGCPITATFYVSHEWTDYSQVQNLYADGHEMASHTISHGFGEQFSQKKWNREVAGQREILSAYGGVKLSDVRGMRAPFLSIGGNKMFKMLYDSNFTYDSSMPVYENRPPSWPYTLDYKIFHDCMIPPCPTKSYPGVWQVPMVMWQDLNGGRCSMGDACSNPADADGVAKMIMRNFERHYTTNRAPFGLYYHAAWFTQPHHKQGFIKFLDTINAMDDVYLVTNWQAIQWVRDPTPISRMQSFQPFKCDYSDRPKRCTTAKVCNLWHKSGVRYMRTCQPCPDIYPWTGKSGIRSSRIDHDVDE